jgi:uncharacterized protein YjbI with pentapeptide repeats
MARPRHRHRRAEDLAAAVTADEHRGVELTALATVAEAVLADLRSAASAIRALVGPVGVDLYGANLAGADLHDAFLTRASLTGADLHDAILTCTDLVGANLACADLQNADLTRTDLHDANLACADLHDANLTRADLCGANLLGANLHDANLAQVLWSSRTLWPEAKASLMRNGSEELRPGVWRVIRSGNSGHPSTPNPPRSPDSPP